MEIECIKSDEKNDAGLGSCGSGRLAAFSLTAVMISLNFVRKCITVI